MFGNWGHHKPTSLGLQWPPGKAYHMAGHPTNHGPRAEVIFWYQKPPHVATNVGNGHEDNCPTKEDHPSQHRGAPVLVLGWRPLGSFFRKGTDDVLGMNETNLTFAAKLVLATQESIAPLVPVLWFRNAPFGCKFLLKLGTVTQDFAQGKWSGRSWSRSGQNRWACLDHLFGCPHYMEQFHCREARTGGHCDWPQSQALLALVARQLGIDLLKGAKLLKGEGNPLIAHGSEAELLLGIHHICHTQVHHRNRGVANKVLCCQQGANFPPNQTPLLHRGWLRQLHLFQENP